VGARDLVPGHFLARFSWGRRLPSGAASHPPRPRRCPQPAQKSRGILRAWFGHPLPVRKKEKKAVVLLLLARGERSQRAPCDLGWGCPTSPAPPGPPGMQQGGNPKPSRGSASPRSGTLARSCLIPAAHGGSGSHSEFPTRNRPVLVCTGTPHQGAPPKPQHPARAEPGRPQTSAPCQGSPSRGG